MAVKPTPTQEEIDKAATGEHVMKKEYDGSSLDLEAMPGEETLPDPPLDPEPQRKQVEARPPRAGYEIRQVKPAKPAAAERD